MRVFLSCLQSLRPHAVPAYDFWAPYFKRGLEEAGHGWVEAQDADWAEGLCHDAGPALEAWRARTWSRAVESVRRQLERAPVDMFLGYLYPHMVDAAAIREIRRLGVPCVNFFCDNVRELRRPPPAFAEFDLHWVPEYEALPMYQKARYPHVLAPMPCWIPPEQRRGPVTECRDATFVGSRDPLRQALLSRAIALGAPITAAGAGWLPDDAPAQRARGASRRLHNQLDFVRRHGIAAYARKIEAMLSRADPAPIPRSRLSGRLGQDAYVEWTRDSRVTLGINRVPTFHRAARRPVTYSRLRDVEAPMMGACYLTEWTAGLHRFFELGRDIETYRTADELAAKIAELLADAERRVALRRAGQRRALGELSVGRSIERIAAALGLARGPHA